MAAAWRRLRLPTSMAGTGAQSARGLLGGGKQGLGSTDAALTTWPATRIPQPKNLGQCQNEGKQWSKDLKDNNSDPPEDPDVIEVKKKILLLRRKSARQPRPPSEQTQSAGTTTMTTKALTGMGGRALRQGLRTACCSRCGALRCGSCADRAL